MPDNKWLGDTPEEIGKAFLRLKELADQGHAIYLATCRSGWCVDTHAGDVKFGDDTIQRVSYESVGNDGSIVSMIDDAIRKVKE